MEKNELSACLSHKAISILHRLVQSSFVLIVLGCGGSHDQSSSQTANQIAQVSEKTFCETSATCAGLNGFAIDGQGNFTAGPSSTGKRVSGSITSAELASLKSMVNSVMANSSAGTQCVVGQPQLPFLGDDINANFTDGSHAALYHQVSGQECFLGNPAVATPLRDFAHQLLQKYYPIPFPS